MPTKLTFVPKAYKSPSYHAAWIAPVALVFVLGMLQPSFVSRIQDQVFDLYQRLAPRNFDPSVPVRIVDIDDQSIARLGQWPWPRTQIAVLVKRLERAGAAAIAFDMVFSEQDRTSAEAFLAALRDDTRKQAVRTALDGIESNDAVLAHALSGAPVVLGLVVTQGTSRPVFNAPYGIATAGDDLGQFLPAFSGVVAPLPVLSDVAAGLGALNWLPDGDQIVRRVPLLLKDADRVVPSLALESLRVAQGASTFVVRTSSAATHETYIASGVQDVRVGGVIVSSDPEGDARLRFTRHRSERFLPAWKIVDGTFDPSAIEGRVVIVGSSAAGLTDIRATPVDPAMPGVEIQAQAMEGLLTQTRLVRPSWSVLELFAGLMLAAVLAVVLPLVPALASTAAIIAGLAVILTTSWWAFLGRHLLIDPIMPGAMLLATYLGGMSILFGVEQRDRRFVQAAFGRFVSPDVVDRLARDSSQLALGGDLRTLTVMFTDVRNFSTIAERMSAQDLTRFMNSYLSPMSEIVLSNSGTVDKYVGDAIMAFWNAPLPDPDHGVNAARAALAMIAALPALQAMIAAKHEGVFPPIRCGIGLASGPCVVGNLGSNLRFDYSALGDDVNLASRLEGLTKVYGVDILATDATRELAPHLAWLEVDNVIVVGRAGATRIATLLGDEDMACTDAYRALYASHETMLGYYRRRSFDSAILLIQSLRTTAPTCLLKVYDMYEERCQALLLEPPAESWDTITRMASK